MISVTFAAVSEFILPRISPLDCVSILDKDRWQQLSALFEEWNPVAFVVGVPLHGDGSESEHTLRCRRFARQLGGRFRRHVFEVDERYSSVVVESGREKIDDRSAALLLQQFFDESSAQS